MWLVIATGTIQRVFRAPAFVAPCLGTDLFMKKHKAAKDAAKKAEALQKETV
jgi:hypothetical protein